MADVRALDPGGVLERPTTIDGDARPLWRALLDAAANDPMRAVRPALLDRYGLSVTERLEVVIDIARRAYGLYGLELWSYDDIAPSAETARWAPGHADRLQHEAEALGAPPNATAVTPLVLALLRNGIPIEARWDKLLPVHAPDAVLLEIWRSIPAKRREAVLYDRLRAAYNVAAYPTAALLAGKLRSRACARYLSEQVDALDSPPRAKVKALIKAIAPDLARRIKTLSLRVVRTSKPRSPDDLSPIERAQLLAAMDRYDGRALSLEARFAAEDDDDDDAGSVASTLERVELGGGRSIEGFLYMADSGTFFEGGTTEVVAEVIQLSLQCDDPVLEAALRAALGWG